MNLYLSPRIGDGTYENMYQARHAETDSNRGAVDIRASHYLLLADTPVAGAIKIGHPEEKLTRAATIALRRMGCEVRGKTLAEAAFNILRYPTIPNLKPLTPGTKSGGYELVMAGHQIYFEPYVKVRWVNTLTEWQWLKNRYIEIRNEGFWHGGGFALAAPSVSDDFARVDEDPITGWTHITDATPTRTTKIVSEEMEIEVTASNQDHFNRYDTALDSTDMTASITYKAGLNVSGGPGGGAGARKANDGLEDYYYFAKRSSTTNETELAVIYDDGGSFGNLGRNSFTVAADDVFSITVDGSSISGIVTGESERSNTDTNVDGTTEGGPYAGVYIRTNSSSTFNATWDDFSAAVLGGGGGPTAGTLSLLGVGT